MSGVVLALFLTLCLGHAAEKEHASEENQAKLADTILATAFEKQKARASDLKKLTSQTQLERIATSANDPLIRAMAASRLTNQVVLGKIAFEDDWDTVRRAAITNLTDQAVLAKLALDEGRHYNSYSRLDAVEKLTDQKVLYEVANSPASLTVLATAAVRQMTDQDLIAKLILESRDLRVEFAGLDQLTNQVLLAKIYLEEWHALSEAAEKKLSDPAAIELIAVRKDYDIGARFVRSITNQTILAKVAVEARSDEARQEAFSRLTDPKLLAEVTPWVKPDSTRTASDQTLLAQIARYAHDLDVRKAAVDTLTNQSQLAAAAIINSYNDEIYKLALAKISDEKILIALALAKVPLGLRFSALDRITNQTAISEIAINTKGEVSGLQFRDNQFVGFGGAEHDAKVYNTILARLTDTELLVKVILEAKYPVMRQAAVSRLGEQSLLARLVLESKDLDVRKTAFDKLDELHLEDLAKTSPDAAVALAVEIKLKRQDWNAVFDAANLAKAGLGNVIGAAALITEPQPTAASVVAACHAYIKKGDESRIPELRDLLLRFGDKPLAEDYLNCGHPSMSAAASEWANKKGYNVNTGFGSHRVRWGSGL